MVCTELPGGGNGIGDATKPDGREHERSRPSLRTFVQQLDLIVAEALPAAFDEQLARLGERERELIRAQL